MRHPKFGVAERTAKALSLRMQRLGVVEDDLDEQFMRSRGPGGQHVNKSSTAVRLCHRPTGLEFRVESHRSQGLKRFFARRLLCDELARQAGEKTAADLHRARAKKQKDRRRRRRMAPKDDEAAPAT